ncbi:hypothetical protein FFLO_02495 [Filobasidium floriforme]|uniref:Uncharacterized protein n=1 Tax=Filobasidium floriforme TaxID=5210 RepID=A0A8K0NP18_9TREE|nr:hypothetical protein FFLO_02495 [Filobasidium floriforme]
MCFKKRFTALLTVIPGPREPELLYLNRILEPIVADIQLCEKGFVTDVAGRGVSVVQARILLNASDLPAVKKLTGCASHSSNRHPCHWCGIQKAQLNTIDAYQWRNLPPKRGGAQGLIEACFAQETANYRERMDIEQEYGVRFSEFLRVAGFEHGRSNPIDPLHNSFLGLSKAFVNWLFQHDMFAGELDGVSRKTIFCDVYENADFPGHLGRIPARISRQFSSDKKKAGAGLKADQWRRVVQMLPVALYCAWRTQDGDEIDPIIRNRVLWYRAALSLTAGLRILHAHSISMDHAEGGVQDLSNAASQLLALGVHLTINWHMAMHYAECVMLYGPLSGFGTWAFERNNGALSRALHNQKPHDVPSTLMRFWWRELLLIAILSNPSPNATEREKQALADILADREQFRGTVMMEEARQASPKMCLPQPYQKSRIVDLGQHAAYQPFLDYLSTHYPEIGFIDQYQYLDGRPCVPRRSNEYRLYTHVIYQGYKFCSALYSRTRRDQYALALTEDGHTRHLVRIKLFLSGDLFVGPRRPPIHVELALVETFHTVPGTSLPWGVRSIDTGIRIYTQAVKDTRFIDLASLHASTIVSKIATSNHGDCLVSISCDKEGEKPEFWLAADHEDMVEWPEQDQDD